MFRGAAGTEPLVSGPEALKTELIRLAIYESSNQVSKTPSLPRSLANFSLF